MRALITIGKALDLLNISSQGSNYGLARFLSLTPKSLGPQGDSIFNLVF